MEKIFTFVYRHYASIGEMSGPDKELAGTAKQACASAYARYSNFRVGAAALLESGRVITGSNQESEVFPSTVCAERSMLYYHQANWPGDKIIALAIASDPDERECYPCGICRQAIVDAEKRQGSPIRVIMCGRDSATVVSSSKDLLPFTFQL